MRIHQLPLTILALLLLAVAVAQPATAQLVPPAATPAPVVTPAPEVAGAEPLTVEERAALRHLIEHRDSLVQSVSGHGEVDTKSMAARQARYAGFSKGDMLLMAFKVCVLGLIVVMTVLGIIAIVTHLLNKWEERGELAASASASAAAAVPSAATAPPSVPAEGYIELDPKISVVITAAVAAVLAGRRFRVNQIHVAHPPSAAWSQLGRQSIHASHQLRR